MDLRGPDSRERRLALALGLRLVRRRYGYWALTDANDEARFVFRGSNAGWRDFRRHVADIAGDGPLF